MRALTVAAALTGALLLTHSASAAADPAVACSLLTQAQVAAATGAAVGAGSPINVPTSCQWRGQGKMVTLTINQTLAGKTALDRFNDGKSKAMFGVTVEPVGGLGDDAYYVFYAGQANGVCSLLVKKGSVVFEIRVYGFDIAQAKTVGKALAQNAVGKV
jgi:hypothetical protein